MEFLMDHLWITPGARDPLIDHPRPALPRCYRLPLLPHRCCHTETPFAAAWARCALRRKRCHTLTLLLPRHCATVLALSRECQRDRFIIFYGQSEAAGTTLSAVRDLPHWRPGLGQQYVEL